MRKLIEDKHLRKKLSYYKGTYDNNCNLINFCIHFCLQRKLKQFTSTMSKINLLQCGGIQILLLDSISVGGMLSDMHPVNVGGKLEMMRVRATDPRPCPKCGKIYRSAHTLRTHMEDKHTLCPGYRCVLCGTVAKSRNSLHSHMSRQHRGISTKDLPVLPMPAPFDPDLASKLLSKAGVKVMNVMIQAFF